MEVVSKTGIFAEIGLKAAGNAHAFLALDLNRDGKLGLEDLVNIFGQIDDVDYEKVGERRGR